MIFTLRELRIWNEAVSLGKLKMRALNHQPESGEPNLVKYYKFTNNQFKEYVSGRVEQVDLTLSYKNSFDSYDTKFNFACPLG